jgi:hypothetical protein
MQEIVCVVVFIDWLRVYEPTMSSGRSCLMIDRSRLNFRKRMQEHVCTPRNLRDASCMLDHDMNPLDPWALDAARSRIAPPRTREQRIENLGTNKQDAA